MSIKKLATLKYKKYRFKKFFYFQFAHLLCYNFHPNCTIKECSMLVNEDDRDLNTTLFENERTHYINNDPTMASKKFTY